MEDKGGGGWNPYKNHGSSTVENFLNCSPCAFKLLQKEG